MPTAIKVADRKLGIDYGFMYLLRDHSDLQEYCEQVMQPRWSYGFADFLVSEQRGASHAETREGNVIVVLAQASGKSALLAMATIQDRTYLGMSRMLTSGPVVVNRNGGYFQPSHHELRDEQELDAWVLPGATLKISQWPNGKHWYAKIGDEDVYEGDRNKWNTRLEAQQVGERFARMKGITLERGGKAVPDGG